MNPDAPNSGESLLIFGASARAAAQSAVQAGFHPLCADRYADEDLRETAEVLPLDNYPVGLLALAERLPRTPWIYTGALENRPNLLESLALRQPLLGNPAEVVRAVRDPFHLHAILSRAGLPALAVLPSDAAPPRDGSWLSKPLHGSGGRGIAVWDASAPVRLLEREPRYFQQRAVGRSMSALFVGTAVRAVLIGVSEQWIGVSELGGSPFSYCGSVGPIALDELNTVQIREIGEAIASTCRLRGLFGIDFILERETCWLTEVNPRYPASTEIYEWAWDVPLLRWHTRACASFNARVGSLAVLAGLEGVLQAGRFSHPGRREAKTVVYAPFDLRVPDLRALVVDAAFTEIGIEIADRSKAGALICRGGPVCTLVAHQADSESWTLFQRAHGELVAAFERHRT